MLQAQHATENRKKLNHSFVNKNTLQIGKMLLQQSFLLLSVSRYIYIKFPKNTSLDIFIYFK